MTKTTLRTESRFKSRLILIGLWTTFTVALAIWWYIFSLRQLERTTQISQVTREEAMRERTMLTLEGVVLIVCLVGGGGALAYLVLKDLKQQRQLMDFFLTFTHELKTPLTNIQLQAEELSDRLNDTNDQRLAQNLLNETARLTLQLDNSLYLARGDSSEALFLEHVHLSDLVRELAPEYPALTINLSEDQMLFADRVALLTILRNIARNALIHGEANKMKLSVEKPTAQSNLVKIVCSDNGKGLGQNVLTLGTPFLRQSQTSGNGLGLYICKRLAKLMDGDFQIHPEENHLRIILTLRGASYA